MIIKQASLQDIPSVLNLLKANHADYVSDKSKGFVTTNITKEQMISLIQDEDGVTIAKDEKKVIAFALAASWKYWSDWPFFSHMIEELPKFNFNGKSLTTENSYQYGPVCVDERYRRKGIFEKVFFSSLANMKNRYPLMATFVNQINPISYKAHTKGVGMKELGNFDYNNNHYYLLACPTSLNKK